MNGMHDSGRMAFMTKSPASLRTGDIKKLASLTSRNFDDPITTIIPWATTHFTEVIIQKAKETFKDDYWGFLMLGGMSGGGMGMFVDPAIYEEAKHTLLQILQETKNEMEESLPFAMNPVVYNFALNTAGHMCSSFKRQRRIDAAAVLCSAGSPINALNSETIPDSRKVEIDLFSLKTARNDEAFPILRSIIGNVFKYSNKAEITEKHQQDKEVGTN